MSFRRAAKETWYNLADLRDDQGRSEAATCLHGRGSPETAAIGVWAARDCVSRRLRCGDLLGRGARYDRVLATPLRQHQPRTLVPPEILEPIRREVRVTHRVLDIFVSHPGLDGEQAWHSATISRGL